MVNDNSRAVAEMALGFNDSSSASNHTKRFGISLMKKKNNAAHEKEQEVKANISEKPVLPLTDLSIEKKIDDRRKERSERSAGFCHKCGRPIQQSDLFCPGCGEKLTR